MRKLELAVGGTLFLEGVHELPLGLQQSLGPLLEQHSDVRVIASTTRDLSRDVLSGRIDAVFLKLFKSQIQVPALVETAWTIFLRWSTTSCAHTLVSWGR